MSRHKSQKPKPAKQSAQQRTKPKKLTRREQALFKGMLEGKTITEAARDAGYSPDYAAQAGSRAVQQIKAKAPDLFSRHGLDSDTFVEKCILPALRAQEVKVFRTEDKIIYSKPLVAWGPRVATNRLVAEMMGLVLKEQEDNRSQIRVVVINQAHRPPRAPIVPIPQIPGLPAPKVSDGTSR